MTEKQFIARQEKFWEEIRKATAKIEAAREKVATTCTHQFTEPYTYTTDNGYGRLGRGEGLMCRICQARNPYPTMSKHWISYEEWLRSD